MQSAAVSRATELTRVNSHVYVSSRNASMRLDPSAPSYAPFFSHFHIPRVLTSYYFRSVIIVFGWCSSALCFFRSTSNSHSNFSPTYTVNARIAHEKKYVDIFKSIYPTSTLVLVKADTSWLYTSQAGRVSTHPCVHISRSFLFLRNPD
jgi:hypothetical protein